MPWGDVSEQEAVRAEYYGVRGWLKFFYVLAVLGFLSSLLELNEPDPRAVEMFDGSAGMTPVVSLVTAALQIPFLILVPIKHPPMPNVDIACTWIQVAIILPFLMNLDASSGLPASVATTISVVIVVMAALWTWYLLGSKRVNVTYRNRVPS